MSIEQSIKNAMAAFIERIERISEVEVTAWEEEFDAYAYGGCETCGPEIEKDYTVTIYYTWNDTPRAYTHRGPFTELIKELDNT